MIIRRPINLVALVGALLLSLLAVGLIEWVFASVIVWLPQIDEIPSLDIAYRRPLYTFELAWQVDLFVNIQFVMVAVYMIFAYKLYHRLSGQQYQEASDYGAHGTARFARAEEILNDQMFVKKTWDRSPEENLRNTAGLIFGKIQRGWLQQAPLILPEDTKIPNRNVFIVGSPGSGKTQSYILTNILFERDRSIVVTDPKGEIYEATAKLKKEQGYEVRLINFKEMTVSDRYNPIDYIRKEIDAEQVATTIVLNSQMEKKPDFFTKAEIALLKTLLLYIKYECPKEATLAKAKEILTEQGSNPKKMDRFFGKLDPEHPAYQAYAIVRMAEDRTRASIFISLGITLSKFIAKDVRRFMENSDFQLDDLGQRKMILYCILPVADETWEALISTFFTQMFQRLYHVADQNFNQLPVKVNLLLDEFPNLGKIPGYEQILATCRSYGISASTVVQSMGQLIDKYSKEKAEAIIGNCSLRFLLGVGDKMTAEYFSEMIGKTTIQTDSTSVSEQAHRSNESTSKSYTGRILLTPDELARMSKKEAILLVSGLFPIKLYKTFQFEFFQGILHPDNQTSRFHYYQLRDSMEESTVPPIQTDDTSLTLEQQMGLYEDWAEIPFEDEQNLPLQTDDNISRMLQKIEKDVDRIGSEFDIIEENENKQELEQKKEQVEIDLSELENQIQELIQSEVK